MKGMYGCGECGREVTREAYEHQDSRFCPECGGLIEERETPAESNPAARAQKSSPAQSRDLRPVTFVPHWQVMLMLTIAAIGILAAILIPLFLK